jgi:hypothetical protein
VKLTFYIDTSNDAERCGDSLRLGNPISISGEDPLTGRIKPYKGIILAVEPVTGEDLGERWRVAIETATR